MTQRQMSCIKEGFLVKKGHWRHNWKSRWFVLQEDCLLYYRKSDLDEPVGSINLLGASVVSPVPDYSKREAVFKVSTHDGKEYLFQAPHDDAREVWTHAISAMIRSHKSTAQTSDCSNAREMPTRLDLSDMLGAMQDPDAGVGMTTVAIDSSEYNDCFAGRVAVDWLLKWSFATHRVGATQLCDELLRLAHIQPVQISGKKVNDVTPEVSKRTFLDSSDIYYKFSHLSRRVGQGLPFDDSSSESSSSSEGELSESDILDESERLRKGALVKEGFLVQRRHNLRKKWKVRKMVLRKDPACLEYHSATKGSKIPLKVVDLSPYQVYPIERNVGSGKDDDDVAVGVPVKRKKHMFCLKKDGEGKVIIFQTEDEHSKEAWMKSLRQVCPAHG